MKMVANETELRNALKEKAQEITIVTSYADTVMKRYSVELTTTWPTILLRWHVWYCRFLALEFQINCGHIKLNPIHRDDW